jgi:hypothetical protein
LTKNVIDGLSPGWQQALQENPQAQVHVCAGTLITTPWRIFDRRLLEAALDLDPGKRRI